MRDLLEVIDRLDDPQTPPARHQQAPDKLAVYRLTAESRFDGLRNELRIAESFAGKLRRRLADHQDGL